ncbi:MAG: hypothetical protein AB9891_06215 [Anaerolineaceae bacterium]
MISEIVGVYKIVPTMESILKAVKFHEYRWRLDENGEYAYEIYWDVFKNLCLFELQVKGFFEPDIFMVIKQIQLGISEDSQQSPYMEFYMDSSGEKLLSEQEAVKSENCRICFFLHFVGPNTPLSIGEISLSMPPITALPDRLIKYTHYVPPD